MKHVHLLGSEPPQNAALKSRVLAVGHAKLAQEHELQ
jgi:hypothetical protein